MRPAIGGDPRTPTRVEPAMPAPTSAAARSTIAASSRLYGRPGASRLTETRPTTSPFGQRRRHDHAVEPGLVEVLDRFGVDGCADAVLRDDGLQHGRALRDRVQDAAVVHLQMRCRRSSRRRSTGAADRRGGRRREGTTSPSRRARGRRRDRRARAASASATSSMTVSALTAAASSGGFGRGERAVVARRRRSARWARTGARRIAWRSARYRSMAASEIS